MFIYNHNLNLRSKFDRHYCLCRYGQTAKVSKICNWNETCNLYDFLYRNFIKIISISTYSKSKSFWNRFYISIIEFVWYRFVKRCIKFNQLILFLEATLLIFLVPPKELSYSYEISYLNKILWSSCIRLSYELSKTSSMGSVQFLTKINIWRSFTAIVVKI